MDPLSTAVGAAAALAASSAVRALARVHRLRVQRHDSEQYETRTRASRTLLDDFDPRPAYTPEASPEPQRTVILTFLAPAPAAPPGHQPWHPILHLAQLEGRRADELVLLHTPSQLDEAERLRDELTRAHGTDVALHPLAITDPNDFDQIYDALRHLAQEYEFDTTVDDYLVHASAGSSVAQACLVLMAQRQQLPAQLLWTWPPWESATPHRIRGADLARDDAERESIRIEANEVDIDPLLRSRNPGMQEMLGKVQLRARLNIPLTFLGETGTGKSALGKLAHTIKLEHLGRSGPLVQRNCSTVREDLAPSILFGHKRGAFTGAVADQLGWFLEAHGGTLFLDEFALLSWDVQGMLLSALEDHHVTPVGAPKPVATDIHLVVATNRDVEEEVLAGRIRDDLWARLGPAVFRLPPLRERTEDIEPTLPLALRQASARIGRHVTMLPEAWSTFVAFATSSEARWVGNFREYFGSVLAMAMDVQATGVITLREVQGEIAVLRKRWSRGGLATMPSHAAVNALLPPRLQRIDLFDKVSLVQMIRACEASATLADAGRILFDVTSRDLKRPAAAGDRLRKALKAHALTFEQIKAGRIE